MNLIIAKSDLRVIYATNGTITPQANGTYKSSEGVEFNLDENLEIVSADGDVPDDYISGLSLFSTGMLGNHPDRAVLMAQKQAEKDQRILDSNWTQLPDSGLTDEEKQLWTEYRRQVREVSEQPNPFEIVFPLRPNEEPVY